MSSIRTELYNFLKAIISGKDYTDYMDTERTFTGISEVCYFGFWNSNITLTDNNVIPLPAVLFEINQNANFRTSLKTTQLDTVGNIKDNVVFTLHILHSKLNSINEQPYIDAMDMAEKVLHEIQGKSCAGVQFIRKIDEYYDADSSVILDYQLQFTTVLHTSGTSDSVQVDPFTNEIQISIE